MSGGLQATLRPYQERIAELEREVERLRADREQVADTLLEVQQAYARLLSVARGCHDYGGGYHDPLHAHIFHHGIQTVINAMEAVEREPGSLQVKVLERIGSADQPHTAFEVEP